MLAAPSSKSAPTFSASAEPPLPADPDPTSTEQPAPGSIWDGWTTDINSPRLVLELLVRNMLSADRSATRAREVHCGTSRTARAWPLESEYSDLGSGLGEDKGADVGVDVDIDEHRTYASC